MMNPSQAEIARMMGNTIEDIEQYTGHRPVEMACNVAGAAVQAHSDAEAIMRMFGNTAEDIARYGGMKE